MSIYIYKADETAIKISGAELVYHKSYGRFININGTYIKNGSIYIQTENDTCLISIFYGNYWEIRLSTGTLAADIEQVATCNSTGSEFPLTGQWTWSGNITKYTSTTINLITTETSIYKKPLSDAMVYTSSTNKQTLKDTDRIYINGEWRYFGLSNDDFYTGDLIITQTTGEKIRLYCGNYNMIGTDRVWYSNQQGGSGGAGSNTNSLDYVIPGGSKISYISYADGFWGCYVGSNVAYGSGGTQPWNCRYVSDDTNFDATIPLDFITKE